MSASPAAVQSALPAAVRKAAARANELAAQFAAGQKGTPPAAPDAPAPAAPAPPAAAAAAAPAAPAPAAPAAPEDALAAAQHRYNVLQGKYNAEVPRLQNQVREQDQTIRDMRQQLTNMQTMLASLSSGQSAPNAQPPAQPAARRVKDDEIRQFGPDLYDFIKRTSLEAVLPEVERVAAPIQQRLTKTEQAAQGAAQTVAVDAVQRLYALLNEQVPDWEQMNEAPEFLAWLGERDPYAGVPREKLLAQAYEAHDGPRVVAFFKGFKSENAAVSPQPQPSAPAAPEAAPEAQMLQLVAPGTPKAGSASGAPNDAGKRVWTRADVQGLYAKINEFTKKNKQVPVELRQLEADLIRAQAEGRIRV